MKPNRLSKILSSGGFCSRRKAEELIQQGRITVNGVVTLVPQTLVDPTKDKLCFDKKPISLQVKRHYYIINKPPRYVCSSVSSQNHVSILELFSKIKERLFTVGRLDQDTTGLLIVTNDGHFANQVIHPSSNVQKQYIAKADKEITAEHLAIMSKGTLIYGSLVKPVSVRKIRKGTVSITVNEGKNREVKRIMKQAGLKTVELKRVRIGNLHLGELPLGAWRALTDQEKQSLFS